MVILINCIVDGIHQGSRLQRLNCCLYFYWIICFITLTGSFVMSTATGPTMLWLGHSPRASNMGLKCLYVHFLWSLTFFDSFGGYIHSGFCCTAYRFLKEHPFSTVKDLIIRWRPFWRWSVSAGPVWVQVSEVCPRWTICWDVPRNQWVSGTLMKICGDTAEPRWF